VTFRALPAVKRVGHLLFSNFGSLVRLTAFWLSVVLSLAGFSLFAPYNLGGMLRYFDYATSLYVVLAVAVLIAAVGLYAYSAVSIAIHRRLLLEASSDCGVVFPEFKITLRYVANIIGIIIFFIIYTYFFKFMYEVMAGVVKGPLEHDLGIKLTDYLPKRLMVEAAGLAGIIGFFYCMARLTVHLPAIAIGRKDYGAEEGFLDSIGKFVQLLVFVILVRVMPTMLCFWLTSSIGSLEIGFGDLRAGSLWRLLVFFVQVVLWWSNLVIGIVATTVLYERLGRGQEN
jgi:hypothetical protein